MLDADLILFDELRSVDFGDVFMLHSLELMHKAHVFDGPVGFFNEILLKIHNVFIWSLLCTIDLDMLEMIVLSRLDIS